MTLALAFSAFSAFTIAGQRPARPSAQRQVELENADVRVHRIRLAEGEALAAFQHLESVGVFVQGNGARVTPADPAVREWSPGSVKIVPAGQHRIENTAGDEVEIVWVELKKGGSPGYVAMPRDPMTLDRANTTLIAENGDVRIVRHVVPQGAVEPEHDHPSAVSVYMTAATGQQRPGFVEWTDGPFSHGGTPASQATNVIVIEPKTGQARGSNSGH